MTINKIPFEFMAGSTFDVTINFPDYQSTSYSSNLLLVNSTAKYTIPASGVSTGEFQYYSNASGTSAYVASDYTYTITATSGADTYIISQGALTITPNLITSTGTDTRSTVKKTLDAIDAAIEGRITSDVANYSIGNRMIAKLAIADLLKFKSIYQQKYNEELRVLRKESRNIKLVYKDMYEPSSDPNNKRIL